MLRYFKVKIEPIDSQKRQAPLWTRETKTIMMTTFQSCKLSEKFVKREEETDKSRWYNDLGYLIVYLGGDLGWLDFNVTKRNIVIIFE